MEQRSASRPESSKKNPRPTRKGTDYPALLAGLRKGEDWAFSTLTNELEDPLLRFFLVSHRDPALAREQVVEVFANLLHELPRMTADASALRGFVFGVARNVLRRSWRLKTREEQRRTLATAMTPEDQTEPSPLDRILLREEVSAALDLLQKLDPLQREIAQLRFLEEFSLDEIAEALDRPVGTIKSHIHRIRARLEQQSVLESKGVNRDDKA